MVAKLVDLNSEFQRMAVAMFVAYKAMTFNETPVACILFLEKIGGIEAIGYNATNMTLNGTKHAEFIAMEQIIGRYVPEGRRGDLEYLREVFKDMVLYVTVEPCIMCASALQQVGIGKVVFGCANDRFGGNGTVLKINVGENYRDGGEGGGGGGGGGGGRGYPSYGGIMRTEAIQLLRNFYIQENKSAPVPQIKKNRELECKEYPPNLQFCKYLTLEEFELFYGRERVDYFTSQDREITPIKGKGYSVASLVDGEYLRDSTLIQEFLKSNGCWNQNFDQDFNNFARLFYPVNDDNTIDFRHKIVTIDNMKNGSGLHTEDDVNGGSKKRKFDGIAFSHATPT